MKKPTGKELFELKQLISQLDEEDQNTIVDYMEYLLTDPKYKPRKKSGNIISMFERED